MACIALPFMITGASFLATLSLKANNGADLLVLVNWINSVLICRKTGLRQ